LEFETPIKPRIRSTVSSSGANTGSLKTSGSPPVSAPRPTEQQCHQRVASRVFAGCDRLTLLGGGFKASPADPVTNVNIVLLS